MSEEDVVSIVVPVYMVEKHLDRCVRSLLTQTHQNLEVILVDDGSFDRSGAICDGYSLADPRVQVIHQENAGPAAARNAGIDRVSGRFTMFVDSDDWVHRELVSQLLALLDGDEVDIAVCRFVWVSSDDVAGARADGRTRSYTTREALSLFAGGTASLMTSPCAKLYRTGLFQGVRFPVGRFHEDEFTTYKLVAAARRVIISEAELYYYFGRPESITRAPREVKQFFDSVDALRGQAEFFRDMNLPDVSGDCLRRAFLILRKLRRRVARSGDEELRLLWRQKASEVISALESSRQVMHIRLAARLYLLCPQLFDVAFWIYRSTIRPVGRIEKVAVKTRARDGRIRMGSAT